MGILLIYCLIGIVVIAAGIIVYMFAVASRKSYFCPQCGEKMTTEYLNATHCGHCGADLRRE